MKLRTLLTLLVITFCGILSTGVGYADLLSGCGTCQGSTYLLQYNPNLTTTNGADTVYHLFLTIDTTNYNGGGTAIDSVLVKVSNSVDLPPSALTQAPGGTGAWTLSAGGLNAGGCQLSGDAGALCAQDGQNALVGGVLKWEFDYATTTSLKTGNLASDIKARYVDASGNKVGDLVSEGITLQSCTTDCGGTTQGNVPEPTSIMLLGTVTLLTARGIQKRLKAR